ncbi:MAG: U32 family peptidase, partial [Clostridiales Family XIII bacterium]|nr:U32 family peptidase [Clostridiales Family XIII bacterium]
MDLFVKISEKNQISPEIVTVARYVIMDAEELVKISAADTRVGTIPLHKRCAALPTVVYDPDALEQLHNTLTILLYNGVKAFYIPNLYGFTAMLEAVKRTTTQEARDTPPIKPAIFKTLGITLIAGSELNIANHEAIEEYANMGITETVLTPEITAHQTRRLARKYSVGIYAYGRLPLMTYRSCPLSVHGCPQKSKGTPSHPCMLTDRTGRAFPFQCENPGGVSKMRNSHPLWIADKISSFNGISFAILDFSIEDAAACTRITRAFL